MARFLKILLCLIVLLIIAAVAIPFVVPADKIVGQLLAQIETKTGRKVTLDHASFTLFPVVGFSAQNAVIGNPSWVAGNMVEVKSLKIGMELMPMLHGEYRLKELTLERPVIVLVKDKGKANWQLESGKAAPDKNEDAPAEAKSGKTNEHLSPADLHLDKVSILDGTFTYKDGGKVQTVSGLNLTIKAPNLSENADIDLSMIYGSKKLDAKLALEKPLALETGGAARGNLDMTYGPLHFTWNGTAALSGAVPNITGKLDIPSLNTADFSAKGDASSDGKPPTSPSARPANASRWSDAPIRLDGLKSANTNLEISIGKLTLPKTTLENLAVRIKLSGGHLQVESNPVQAYGGTLNFSLSATSSGALSLSFSAAKAQAEPLLHDFASYDRVSGTIDLETKLAMSGGSERAFINSLSGTGGAMFRNGKLKGVNIAGLIHNVTRHITGGAQAEEDSTEFSELSGTYTVSRGVITTHDFKLNSPLLRVTGEGNADLPDWQEHFLLKPKLVASLTGQGGSDASGIVIPVNVDGPLDHPHYSPDIGAALQENLKDPAKLKENLKDLKKLVPDGKINSDTLKGLLR